MTSARPEVVKILCDNCGNKAALNKDGVCNKCEVMAAYKIIK